MLPPREATQSPEGAAGSSGGACAIARAPRGVPRPRVRDPRVLPLLRRRGTSRAQVRQGPKVGAVGPGLAAGDHGETRVDALERHGAHPAPVAVRSHAAHGDAPAFEHQAKAPLRLAPSGLLGLGCIHAEKAQLHAARPPLSPRRSPRRRHARPSPRTRSESACGPPGRANQDGEKRDEKRQHGAQRPNGGRRRARHEEAPAQASAAARAFNCRQDTCMDAFRYRFGIFFGQKCKTIREAFSIELFS